MKKDKVIEQLESIKGTSQSHLTHYGFNDIMANDIIALDMAIRTIKADRRAKGSFYKGVCITTIVFMLLIATDLFFKSYWGY